MLNREELWDKQWQNSSKTAKFDQLVIFGLFFSIKTWFDFVVNYAEENDAKNRSSGVGLVKITLCFITYEFT